MGGGNELEKKMGGTVEKTFDYFTSGAVSFSFPAVGLWRIRAGKMFRPN